MKKREISSYPFNNYVLRLNATGNKKITHQHKQMLNFTEKCNNNIFKRFIQKQKQ